MDLELEHSSVNVSATSTGQLLSRWDKTEGPKRGGKHNNVWLLGAENLHCPPPCAGRKWQHLTAWHCCRGDTLKVAPLPQNGFKCTSWLGDKMFKKTTVTLVHLETVNVCGTNRPLQLPRLQAGQTVGLVIIVFKTMEVRHLSFYLTGQVMNN